MPAQQRTAETKAFGALAVKDAEKGLVEAIVATFGVVDRDGDIIRKGAVRDGTKVSVSAYGHDAVFGKRPVGKGVLTSEGDRLTFRGRLFLNTAGGRETFEVLKAMETDQQWSFGFRVIDDAPPSEQERTQGAHRVLIKLDAFEVSPVLMGAGIGTRTVAVKDAAAAEERAELEAMRDRVTADIARRAADRQRDTLREIAASNADALAAIEQDEAEQLKREFLAIGDAADQGFLRTMHQKWAPGSRAVLGAFAVPLLTERPEFAPLLKFAMRRFVIPSDRAPTVLLVPRDALRSEGTTGCYSGEDNTIYVAKGLTTEQMERTILHEFAHHYEQLQGWLGSERFAYSQESTLYEQWCQERRAA